MVNFVNYNKLDITAKINCLYNYMNEICPYEDFEDAETLDDMEINVIETLKTGLFFIDECGDWYDECGDKI